MLIEATYTLYQFFSFLLPLPPPFFSSTFSSIFIQKQVGSKNKKLLLFQLNKIEMCIYSS